MLSSMCKLFNALLCLIYLVYSRCSKWQIILQFMFDWLVLQFKSFSWTNVSAEGSSVIYFQWSIVWSIGQRSIKRKSHAAWLYFPIIGCYITFRRQCVTVWSFGDKINLFHCPWWAAFHFASDRSRSWFPLYITLLVQDNIWMTVSRWPDNNWTQNVDGKVSVFCQTSTFCLACGFSPFGRCTYSHSNKRLTSSQAYSSISCSCGCLREVLSVLSIWPWTCAKPLNSSCIKHQRCTSKRLWLPVYWHSLLHKPFSFLAGWDTHAPQPYARCLTQNINHKTQ